jgi:aryl-alcohol dehydrogenase-like predicted oxidoreductase
VRTRRLGSDGPEVSVVGLGCNNFGGRVDLDGTRAVVDAAIDAGVTLFDTADIYGGGRSEEFLGEILEGRRERVVLATKWGSQTGGQPGGSRAYIRKAIEASLRRLRTEWIDLYQHHTSDESTPIEETLAALDELVREGKVRWIGSSNYSPSQIRAADAAAKENDWPRFVSAQNEYSLMRREAEAELLPTCSELGIGVLPYFPLASGLLTGKYRRGEPPPPGTRLHGHEPSAEEFDRVEELERYAAQRNAALLDVAIGGLLAQPAIASVIAGATKPEQVRANVAAGEWEPSPDDLGELAAIR